MEEQKKTNDKVESHTTQNTERVIRTICLKTGVGSEPDLLAHFSFRDGAFFAAMKRAKLPAFDQTFASGFYYTGDAAAFSSPEEDSTAWIWMPVETEADRKFLFSVKPWEESEMSPAVQKEIAKKLKADFEQFENEMLRGADCG